MTDTDIKTICEKIESLHSKILKSKFAEQVTESEVMSLVLAVGEINRQKAEIERLTVLAKLGNTRANDYRVMRDRALKAEAEIERLQKIIDKAATDMADIKTAINKVDVINEHIKSEAYKEFAERLKEEAYPDDSICTQMVVAVEDIDNLLKELEGEQ